MFVTVYIPFFLAALYCHDGKPKQQATFIGAFFGMDAGMLVVLAGLLKWI